MVPHSFSEAGRSAGTGTIKNSLHAMLELSPAMEFYYCQSLQTACCRDAVADCVAASSNDRLRHSLG